MSDDEAGERHSRRPAGRPGASYAPLRQRASGHSAAAVVGTLRAQSLVTRGSWRGGMEPLVSGPRVRNDRSVARWVKARPEKWHADLRQEPGLGKSDRPGSFWGFGKRGQLEKTPRGTRA